MRFANEFGLEAIFEGLDLHLDASVEIGQLLANPGGRKLAVAAILALLVPQLLRQLVEPEGAEDALGKEALNHAQ